MKHKRIWMILALLIITSFGLTACSSPEGTKTFTVAELANYDGSNGNKAYIAVSGKVYDVSSVEGWKNGSHNGVQAGQDLTTIITSAPHGTAVLKNLTIVGTLVD